MHIIVLVLAGAAAMQTMVIRIGGLTKGQGYPLGLYVDDGRNANWVDNPAAEGWLPADLPAPPAPIADVAAVRSALINDQRDRGRLDAVGEYLYGLVADNAVGQAWARVVSEFRKDGPISLRTFFDVRPGELSILPWELMMNGDGTHLFLDKDNLCVRGHYLSPDSGYRAPMRLLVVVGNPYDASLRADDEVDEIWSALRGHPCEWHVEVMWGPTRAELIERFRQVRPHIFHFVGHSLISTFNPSPALEFRTKPNELTTWQLTRGEIIDTLQDAAPRLVFLNSCRSTAGGGSNESRKAVNGVAGAFSQLGTPALLAMQADIDSGSAVTFASQVYRRLANGVPLDAAVYGARDHLAVHAEPLDWALPSLTVRGNPDSVVSMQLAMKQDAIRQLIDERYHLVRPLVDRTEEHRMVWGGIDCDEPPAPAVLVTGKRLVGKTTLVMSCLFTWALRGSRVVYVDLRDSRPGKSRKLHWIDILRRIRDGLATCLPDHTAEPIRRFNHELAYLKDGLDPLPLPPTGGRTDDGKPWSPASEREPELRQAVFRAARRMLEEVAGAEPLLLAVDHLEQGMPYDVSDNLAPYLLIPIAEGLVSRVSVVVAGNEGELAALPQKFRPVKITVTPFPRTIHIFRQFGALTCRPFVGRWRHFAEGFVTYPEPGKETELMPEELSLAASIVPSSEVSP
jgi:CHAT domain